MNRTYTARFAHFTDCEKHAARENVLFFAIEKKQFLLCQIEKEKYHKTDFIYKHIH